MKTIWIIVSIAFAINLHQLFGQTINQIGPGPAGPDIVQLDRQIAYFQGGDTNAPLLVTAWSGAGRIIGEFSGVSSSGRCWTSGNINGRTQLDETNLESLVAAINILPQPPAVTLPQERWLVVCGTRTNRWFKYIYDRANIPKEVEKLFDITGTYLEWFIPEMKGQQITTNLNVSDFYAARNAPKAVLFTSTNILLFDLKEKKVLETVPISLAPVQRSYGDMRAVSSDGNILIETYSPNWSGERAACAIDLAAKKVLWEGNSLEHKRYAATHVAVGGDKGQYLFACGGQTIERWDLATGKCLAVLATNQSFIKWAEVSQNGKVFIAGFDDTTVDIPQSFTIWRADENKPAAHIENGGFTRACLSPDGKTLALINVHGNNAIELRDWEHGLKREVPLRLPHSSVWGSKMFWSPDGTRLFVDHHGLGGYDSSMVIYETDTWKPLARLPIVPSGFQQSGQLLQLLDGDIYSLNVAGLKSLGD